MSDAQHPGKRAFAPATIGNVSCGFDVLGLAVDQPGDIVEVSFDDTINGVFLADITGDDGKLPRDADKNSAAIAAAALMQEMQDTRGLRLILHKKMPIGSGLGSGAASAAAAVTAVNALTAAGLSKIELLPFAYEGEALTSGRHADNVAPSLLGGMVLIERYEPLTVRSIPVPQDLHIALVHPQVEILTRKARAVIPAELPVSDTVIQLSNVAGLIRACYESDVPAMGACLHDRIAEPYRATLIPHFGGMRQTAMDAGAAGFGISGSGPSVFAFCDSAATAGGVAAAVQGLLRQQGVESSTYISGVNNRGSYIFED